MRVRATLRELGHACGRVGAEYKDIARSQRDGQRPFQVLMYMHPLHREQGKRLRARIQGNPKANQLSDLPVALPRQTLCMLAEVPAPTADAALSIALGVVRVALADEGIELTEFHCEVNPGTRAEWEAAK